MEEAPAVECILLAQNASVDDDEAGADTGSDLSQKDWPAEQTVDTTLYRVRQLLSSGHKPTKRHIALEPKPCQKVLKDWDNLFLKDDILYRKHSLNGIDVNQLVLPEVYRDIALQGLHDEASHQGRDCTMSLVKSRFYWPGMDGDIEKFVKIVPDALEGRLRVGLQQDSLLLSLHILWTWSVWILRCLLEDMSTYWSSMTILPETLRLYQPRIS